ncbi:AAEL004614-PA [Aedes aegypti]|uniref:AAEL004614-PA n=1 Tax=Aedes aegypti TaxID=7159 RepID=Q17CD1_AEDAE|nr:AAEL004614-PA [Aedes aegypti]
MKVEMERLTQRIGEYGACGDREVDLSKVRSLRRELKQLDEEFQMLNKAAGTGNKPKVDGFVFPISREEDIERLESAVRCDGHVRAQYVEYLSVTKPLRQGVVQVFSKFFTDEAMTNYNWHGLDRAQYPRTPKKGMQKYDIFYGCMLDAWESHGLDNETLVDQIKKAVYHINQTPRNKLTQRKRELLLYVKPFERLAKAPRKLSVEGFAFPVYTSDEVERLEEAVRYSDKIRRQYVAYLAERKPRHMDIVECFGKFFTDEAMAPYAWNGYKNPRFPRKAMKTMAIFSSCMLEAWERHGVTSMDILSDILSKVITKIAGRRRSNNYNQRKRIQQFSATVVKQDLHETSSAGVTGFSFPLFCEEDVDRLEAAIKTDPVIRCEYIRHLRSLGEYKPSLFAKYFSELFSDLSLYNYIVADNNDKPSNKKDMIEYDIFTHCLLEAWMSQGLTISELTNLLKSVTSSLSERRQLSNRNRRKRSEQIQKLLLKEKRKMKS